MKHEKKLTQVGSFISAEMKRRLSKGECTKRTAVRLAVGEAIAEGLAKPGSLLPSERALVDITDTSLGTVQAALNELARVGLVVRKRGDGTRVSAGYNRSEAIWHFKFLDRDSGVRLRSVRTEVSLSRISELGYFTGFLGEDDQHYIRIRRKVLLSNGSIVRADMFLLYKQAPSLLDIPSIELSALNIRRYLEQNFGLATSYASHVIDILNAEEATDAGFPLEPPQSAFDIRAHAFSSTDTPVYYQRLLCNTQNCRVEF